MRKIIKKVFTAVTFCLLVTCLFVGLTPKALEDSNYVKKIDDASVTELMGNVKLYKQKVKTLYNGIEDTSDKNYAWNDQVIQWIDFAQSESVKVVGFSGDYSHKWRQMTTRKAAARWEQINPGWIVVAGVNGDFFVNTGAATYEPRGNFMQSGDMLHPEIAAEGVIGWKEDGTVITGRPDITSSSYVRVYDENRENIVSEYEIKNVNNAPSETGITLISKDTSKDYDLTDCTVLVGKYRLDRVNLNGEVFIKGEIIAKRTDMTTNVAPEEKSQEFFLVAKDSSLDNIKIGDYLKCEKKFLGDWSTVSDTMGYNYYPLVDNNVPDYVQADGARHPRTVVGFKADGSTVMMVIDGRKEELGRYGVTEYEIARLMQEAGCVNAYNLDGGGSSTLVVRNKYGDLEVINTPSDGQERSDGNHLLVVMRDPGFSVVETESRFNSVSLEINVENEEYFKTCSNIEVTINGVTKKFDTSSSVITFDGLSSSTEYDAVVSFDNLSASDETKTSRSSMYTSVETDDLDASYLYSVENITENSFTVVKNLSDTAASSFTNEVVKFMDQSINFTNGKAVVDGLTPDTDYSFTIDCEFTDPNTGNKVNLTTTLYNVTTKKHVVVPTVIPPVIEKFEQGKMGDDYINFNYTYSDSEEVVTAAYVICGETKTALKFKTGVVKVEGLDFTKSYDYSFKLVLEYDGGSAIKTVESETITLNKTIEEETPKKKGCKRSSASLVISLTSATCLLAFAMKKKK